MRIRPLTDETDKQEMQCKQLGCDLPDDYDEDEIALGFGADPFDIVAELEARLGSPLALN